MLRVWNLSLLVATFSLTILGTFLTRSGVLDSVHAFTESPIGPASLAFFVLVVAVSLVLIGSRGAKLRSPGSIDAPVSREAAFLANNVAFAAFAFVVLLGTVFPLLAEAINGDQLSVGAPYFNRMTAPIGFTLLFLMAVAPALPWRKASTETLHHRLLWPAWAGTLTVVACVASGLRGLGPLLAFGLAAFAGAAALRQLALSVRASRRAGQPVRQALLGRSNGGMVVHLGVVLVAVGFAASSSYGHRAQFRLAPGESARLAGHSGTYLGTTVEDRANKKTTSAQVRVDGGKVYEPALHQFQFGSQAIGSPSVRTGPLSDVYLTLIVPPDAAGVAVIGVNIQPLVAWLWAGGTVMGFGTFLAAWPGRRRRPSTSDPGPEVVTTPDDDIARPEPATVSS